MQVILARVLSVKKNCVMVDPGFHSITEVPRKDVDISHVHEAAAGQVGLFSCCTTMLVELLCLCVYVCMCCRAGAYWRVHAGVHVTVGLDGWDGWVGMYVSFLVRERERVFCVCLYGCGQNTLHFSCVRWVLCTTLGR